MPLRRAKRDDMVSEMVISSALGVPAAGGGGAISKLTDSKDRFHHILSWRCSEKGFSTKTSKNIPMSTTKVVQTFGKTKVLTPNTAGTCTPSRHLDGFSMAWN